MAGKIIAVVLILAIIAGGAYYMLVGRYDSISDILANPGKYTSRDVLVKGTVRETISLSFMPGIEYTGAYSLAEKDSTIWVGTKGEIPQKGAVKVVRGTVEPTLKIMGRSIGTVIIEKEQK